MIRYTLACAEGHRFDSWFASGAAFDRLAGEGHVSCAVCGGSTVTKAPMAPAVSTSDERAPETRGGPSPADPQGPLSTPVHPVERALAEIRRRVEETSDYVGLSFAKEARAIHEGTAAERPIYGEAKPEDARRLIEDGIPVAPLPFRPRRTSN